MLYPCTKKMMRPTNAAIVLFHYSVLLVKYIIMESTVSSSITSHIAILNLSNPHQWAYKKGHSTELLLVKMTEDWRRALANNETVEIVFVDFKNAFDSTSHSVLLQGLGITGDIWLWIKDYLANRNKVTTLCFFIRTFFIRTSRRRLTKILRTY